MKKRSNNTLDSDTKKVISAEPEINTPASEIKKNIKQDAATRNVSNTSNNSVKQKEVLKEEDEEFCDQFNLPDWWDESLDEDKTSEKIEKAFNVIKNE